MSLLPAYDLQNTHGDEIYYKFSVTPSFHLTADMQVIDSQNVGDDTAVVLSLRAKLEL